MLYRDRGRTTDEQPLNVCLITASWTQTTVTWNKPVTENPTFVATASTAKTKAWVDFDVTDAVKKLIATPTTNFGFSVFQESDVSNAEAIFFSSEYATTKTLRPKLVVTTSGSAISSTITKNTNLFHVSNLPGSLLVSFGKKGTRSVEIVNAQGVAVVTAACSNSGSVAITTTDIATGLYLMLVCELGATTTTRVVISR